MMNLMLHSLQPSHGAVNFILAQLYTGLDSTYHDDQEESIRDGAQEVWM